MNPFDYNESWIPLTNIGPVTLLANNANKFKMNATLVVYIIYHQSHIELWDHGMPAQIYWLSKTCGYMYVFQICDLCVPQILLQFIDNYRNLGATSFDEGVEIVTGYHVPISSSM